MAYKKTLLKRWLESEKQLSLQIEMGKITNEIKNKTKKIKKKFKIVKKIEEQSCSIEKVFRNSDIRNIIMKEKQKLLDEEFEKFKDIDWKEIMTIDQFRDIIIEWFRDNDYMDKKTRLNLKLDWQGLCEYINETCSLFWDYYCNDMDYYYEREAFQRKLNGEPLIDTTYQRQYPPKPQKKNTMGEDTKLVCKLLRKTYKNKKQWANKLTQIGREKGFLTEKQCWKKINTLEYAIASYLHHLEEDKKLSEYLLCVKQLIDDHDDIEMEDWDLYY
tara:strand:- start:507 stop:1325 length:819 start_codon:yes stop_codon:yes gene_type:complete